MEDQYYDGLKDIQLSGNIATLFVDKDGLAMSIHIELERLSGGFHAYLSSTRGLIINGVKDIWTGSGNSPKDAAQDVWSKFRSELFEAHRNGQPIAS